MQYNLDQRESFLLFCIVSSCSASQIVDNQPVGYNLFASINEYLKYLTPLMVIFPIHSQNLSQISLIPINCLTHVTNKQGEVYSWNSLSSSVEGAFSIHVYSHLINSWKKISKYHKLSYPWNVLELLSFISVMDFSNLNSS